MKSLKTTWKIIWKVLQSTTSKITQLKHEKIRFSVPSRVANRPGCVFTLLQLQQIGIGQSGDELGPGALAPGPNSFLKLPTPQICLGGIGLFLLLSVAGTSEVLAKPSLFSTTARSLEETLGSPIAEEHCIPEQRNQPPDIPDGQWCYFASRSSLAEGLKAYRQYRRGDVLPVRRVYAPPDLETLFPNFPGKRLEILFINDRATQIDLSIDRPAQPGKVFTYNPADASQLFRYLFGYPAPIWHPYQEKVTVVPATYHAVCLGDGVATSFERYGSTGPVPSIKLFYHSDCEASRYSFADVKDHWARAFIENLSARKIVSGFPDGTYRPETTVTRAEMAVLISEVLATKATRPAIEFRDVAPEFWGYRAIQTAYRAGFLTGYPGRLFKPNRPMSRVEAIAALSASLPNVSNNLEVLSLYRDAEAIPPYARANIANATTAGLVVNYPVLNVLNPNRSISRGETAVVLYQLLFGKEGWVDSPYIVMPSPSPQLSAVTVIGSQASEVGIDYTPLVNLLTAGDFRRADDQTRTILEEIEKRVREQIDEEYEGSLAAATLSNFPCTDLKTIDRLWQSASQGKFGFRTQARVWQETMEKPGSSWSHYAKRLGWTGSGTVDDYKVHSELMFKLAAPAGHLPAIGVWYMMRWPEDTFGPGTGSPVDIGGLDRAIYTTHYLLQRLSMCERLSRTLPGTNSNVGWANRRPSRVRIYCDRGQFFAPVSAADPDF